MSVRKCVRIHATDYSIKNSVLGKFFDKWEKWATSNVEITLDLKFHGLRNITYRIYFVIYLRYFTHTFVSDCDKP